MIPNTSIVRMIKNELYMGVLSNGNAKSAIIPELQIIDEATFYRARELMNNRTTHHAETPLTELFAIRSKAATNVISRHGIRTSVTDNPAMA